MDSSLQWFFSFHTLCNVMVSHLCGFVHEENSRFCSMKDPPRRETLNKPCLVMNFLLTEGKKLQNPQKLRGFFKNSRFCSMMDLPRRETLHKPCLVMNFLLTEIKKLQNPQNLRGFLRISRNLSKKMVHYWESSLLGAFTT